MGCGERERVLQMEGESGNIKGTLCWTNAISANYVTVTFGANDFIETGGLEARVLVK